MVKSSPERIELIADTSFVVIQPDEKTAVMAEDRYLGNVGLHCPDVLEAEHSLVPIGAHSPVAHGEPQMHWTIEAWHVLSSIHLVYTDTLYSGTIGRMREPVKGRTEAGKARETRAHATRKRVVDAALKLFIDHGYAATTVEAIAERAGVSQATIYQAFGTKQAIVERALDVTLAGDHAPMAIIDRPWVAEVQRQPDPRRRLAIVIRETSKIVARAARVRAVLRDAAAIEAGLRSVIAEDYRRRHVTQSALVGLLASDRQLRAGLDLKRATDIFFGLVSDEMYQLMVVVRGWSQSAWRDWLVEAVERELFDDSR